MSALAAPAKFNFDLDLGRVGRLARILDDAGVAAMVAEARQEGREEGRAEEKRAAETRAAEAAEMAARKLSLETEAFSRALDEARAAARREASELGVAVARKLASHLIDSRPEAEILALLDDCLASLDKVPHLVIRCAPALAQRIAPDAEKLAQAQGFAGRLVVMGEPDFAGADCRIEWADGGIARDRASIEAEIETRLAHYITSFAPGEKA